MIENNIQQLWQESIDFISNRNTLDLGAIHSLVDQFLREQTYDPQTFIAQIVTFLESLTINAKKKPQSFIQSLIFLTIECLVFNVYRYVKGGQAFKSLSSSFYGWMSSSQMSIDVNDKEQRQKFGIELIAQLSQAQIFFKKTKIILDKNQNKQRNQKSAEIMVETIDFVLVSEHLSREVFSRLKQNYVGLSTRRPQPNFKSINSVIFSSQLNKVLTLLTQGSDEIHCALIQIYYNFSPQTQYKCFAGLKYSGQDMMINLQRYYINSFSQIQQIFQQSRNPLFRFLKNYFVTFFTPIFRYFHKMVTKIAKQCGKQDGISFYRNQSAFIQGQLKKFIEMFPQNLTTKLFQLKELIIEQHPHQQDQAIVSVKKFFFYSFLLNQTLIQQLYPKHDPIKLQNVYNSIINLFFYGSIKKFTTLSAGQVTSISQLIQKIGGRLDKVIKRQQINEESQQKIQILIRESTLARSYQLLFSTFSRVQFTPKDQRIFQMKKIGQNSSPNSPIYKNYAQKQQINLLQQKQEHDIMAWMSVGGSSEWGQNARTKRVGVEERLKGLAKMDKRQINILSAQRRQIENIWKTLP